MEREGKEKEKEKEKEGEEMEEKGKEEEREEGQESTQVTSADCEELDDIWRAAKEGDVELLGKAMAGALPEVLNAVDEFDNSALYYASHNGHIKCVKMLLSRGALDPGGRCCCNATEDVRPILRAHEKKLKKGKKLRIAQRAATQKTAQTRKKRIFNEEEEGEEELSQEERGKRHFEMKIESAKEKKYFRAKPRHFLGQTVENVLKEMIESGVTEIDIRKCEIGEEGLTTLFHLLNQEEGKLFHLLFMFKNSIGDGGCKIIENHLCEPIFFLSKLNLCQNGITKEGALRLAHGLSENQTLQALDLNNNFVGDEGAYHLSQALRSNQTLHTLSLWNNGLTQQAATHFFDVLGERDEKDRTLRRLNLENNQISDAILEKVPQWLRKKSDTYVLDDEDIQWYLRFLFSAKGAIAGSTPKVFIEAHSHEITFASSSTPSSSSSSSSSSPSFTEPK